MVASGVWRVVVWWSGVLVMAVAMAGVVTLGAVCNAMGNRGTANSDQSPHCQHQSPSQHPPYHRTPTHRNLLLPPNQLLPVPTRALCRPSRA